MVPDSLVYSYSQLSEMIRASRHEQVKLANNTIAHFVYEGKIDIKFHY